MLFKQKRPKLKARNRRTAEFQRCLEAEIPVLKVNDDDWIAMISGPEATPYEDGVFALSVHLPPDYPYSRPRITFQTPILHPNISSEGVISLNVLSVDWSPILTIAHVIAWIRDFLALPNPNDPMNLTIAEVYRRSFPDYCRRVQEHTNKFAK